LETQLTGGNTRLVHWLADPDELGQTVHSGGFAPEFTPSIHDSERSHKWNIPARDTAKCP